MSQSDENYPRPPGFDQPEGVASYSEDQTLPFVDLYSPPDSGGTSTYGTNPYGSQPSSYGAGTYGGGQYPHEQYATPPYQPAPHYGPHPYYGPMSTVPQPQQYGYYAYGPYEHPQSTSVLVLSLLGFVFPVTFFVAWYMGNKAKAEIYRGAPFPYSGSLKIGHVIGKVMSILMLVGVGGYSLLMMIAVLGLLAF